MDLVADTNVWYDLGANLFSATKLKTGGRRLLATPTNHLEICSNATAKTFTTRQAAARAILTHADDILPDTETHLASLWGIKRTPPPLTIKADLQALANATSPIALYTTVPLYPGSSTPATVGLSPWRSHHWNDFCDGIVQAIEDAVPGYAKARAKGTIKHLPGKQQPAFRTRILSTAFETAVINGTYTRARRSQGQPPASPTANASTRARPLLAPYAKMFAHYIIGCACDFAPQPNDFGDLESLLYLQTSRIVLTSEQRWHTIANAARQSTLLAKPTDL